MPAISVLVKPASGNCNMHCDYCFYCDEASKRENFIFGMMSEKTLRNVIKKTLPKATGQYSIAFQGGEPTLCGIPFFETAVGLLREYNENHCRINIALQTNGINIDEKWCEFFVKNNVLVGISIDGTKEIHDSYRHLANGNSAFDRAVHATELFDRYGVQYNVLTVVHNKTVENITDIYRFFRQKGWDYMQFIACLDPIGEERGQKEYSLTPEAYERFLLALFNLWYEDVKRGKPPYIRQFENYMGILLGFMPESCEQCGVCGASYVVEADGSVYPCDFYALDEYRLGNFNDDEAEVIDDKRSSIGFVERSAQHPKECINCKYHSLCRCGCYRNRMNGEAAGLNYFCEAYRYFFDNTIDRFNELADMVRRR